jgi:hypothetical protein
MTAMAATEVTRFPLGNGKDMAADPRVPRCSKFVGSSLWLFDVVRRHEFGGSKN